MRNSAVRRPHGRAGVRALTAALVGLLGVLLVGVVASLTVLAGPVGTVAAGSEPPPPPVTVNEFIPEDRDLSDCISSIPKPGCGSDARGGWRQGVVLGLVLGGMVVIGWRVAVAVRRRDAALNAAVADADARTPDQRR